jgi:hypothetical protein
MVKVVGIWDEVDPEAFSSLEKVASSQLAISLVIFTYHPTTSRWVDRHSLGITAYLSSKDLGSRPEAGVLNSTSDVNFLWLNGLSQPH